LALVTGGNKGIGLEVVRGLASLGHRVIFTSRSNDEGERVRRQLLTEGFDVSFCAMDGHDDASVERLINYVNQTGGLDILVNNAGFGVPTGQSMEAFNQSIGAATKAQILDVMQVNTFVCLRLMQAFIPGMKARGYGRVVNMSSGAGQLTEMNGLRAPYRLSKVSLNAITRIYADELKDTDVIVNAMCPGFIRTDLTSNIPGVTAATPMKTPKEGADTAIWLSTLPRDGPRAGFFRWRKPIPF